MAFQIIRNDITKVAADAIVNTANPEVFVGSGVDTAIYNAAGREKLLAERAKIGELLPGEVGVTGAFDLNAKYIIHVSGPWWQGGDKGEAGILRRCYDNALEAAKEKGCESIAFPLMATGSYKFPKRLGMEIAVAAFTDFLRIAGYALSPISQTDAVVEYFIEHEEYSVMKIDIVLFDYGLDPLSNS